MHCGMSVACLAHYPLHTSSWGGRFPSPSVRTKYLTQLASVPSRGGGRGKNCCPTVKRPLCTSLTPPPPPAQAAAVSRWSALGFCSHSGLRTFPTRDRRPDRRPHLWTFACAVSSA